MLRNKMFIQDFAHCAKTCKNLRSKIVNSWEYREACQFLRKCWINSNGTINEDIKTRYNEISGMSKSISECFPNSEKKNAMPRNTKKTRKRMGKKNYYNFDYNQGGYLRKVLKKGARGGKKDRKKGFSH